MICTSIDVLFFACKKNMRLNWEESINEDEPRLSPPLEVNQIKDFSLSPPHSAQQVMLY